jgi:hypothetical protein
MEHGDTVGVVVDPQFGVRLRGIIARGHVWIVDSSLNRPVAESIWSGSPEGGLSPVTVFDAVSAEKPGDTVVRMVDTIELHHPECKRLEFYGVAPFGAVKQALDALGFSVAESNADGFVARKHAL